jgi:protein-S-isoprenylcysteine O-methyltransferase Ste14
VYAAAVLAGYFVDRRWHWRILPSSMAGLLETAGLVAGVLGLGLMFAAIARFHTHGTSILPIMPTTAIAKDGPYRFTRNPMYLGLLILSMALALVMNSVWPLLFLIPAVVVMNRAVISREEAYLERKFGEQYLEYKRRVRRWI